MNEGGDDYIRRFSNFIRANERNLAEVALPRKQKPEQSNVFNPFSWFGAVPPKALTLSIDTHHLFYILMRLEEIGLDVGTLDVHVENPSRPMSYINVFPDKSDTLSLLSIRSSLSAVSALSLGGNWFGKPEPQSLDSVLKYIFSSFTKIPALTITAPGRKMITELANDSPNYNAIPLDSFRNLKSLEIIDIDPRTLLGWDRLSESLRSLRIRKSGVEDLSDIFIGAVLDDQARRDGTISRKRRRRIAQGPLTQASLYGALPTSTESESGITEPLGSYSSPEIKLPSLKWAFLKQLSLPDNALTFFPSELPSYLTSLSHLDLSSNLLVSVPSGLGQLYNLVSLNLSDNMIDSVLGIYQNLGQVLYLNLSRNRLDSICGLERLHALEKVDLRGNFIEESAEIGRLAPLPNITEVWVDGNPLAEFEENYRMTCLNYFWKEGKSIMLDGSSPSYYEKRNLSSSPIHEHEISRPVSALHSPPTVPVGHAHRSDSDVHSNNNTTSLSASEPSSQPAPITAVSVGVKARRKPKRIVRLQESANAETTNAQGSTSNDAPLQTTKGQAEETVAFSPEPNSHSAEIPAFYDSHNRSRHKRHATELDHNNTSIEELPSFNSLRRTSNRASRQNRVSQSVYEAYGGGSSDEQAANSGEGTDYNGNADAFKRRIEALKKEMGDGWLNVFSQTETRTSYT